MTNPYAIPPRTATLRFPSIDTDRLAELREEWIKVGSQTGDLTEGQPTRMGSSRNRLRKIGEEIEALEREAQENAFVVRLQGIPRADYIDASGNQRPGYTTLIERHTPDSPVTDRKEARRIEEAFMRDLVFESMVEPRGTREEFDAAKWSEPIWEQVSERAGELSSRLLVLPKFSTDSALRALSALDSKPQSDSE